MKIKLFCLVPKIYFSKVKYAILSCTLKNIIFTCNLHIYTYRSIAHFYAVSTFSIMYIYGYKVNVPVARRLSVKVVINNIEIFLI